MTKENQTTEINFIESNGAFMVSSLEIAKHFGKEHFNILRDIELISKDLSSNFTALNFEVSNYLDPTGRTLPCYNLTRDAFTLIAMGFTGKKALEWKVKYIEAFNKMEKYLTEKYAKELYKARIRKPVDNGKGEILSRESYFAKEGQMVDIRMGRMEDGIMSEALPHKCEERQIKGLKANIRLWAYFDHKNYDDLLEQVTKSLCLNKLEDLELYFLNDTTRFVKNCLRMIDIENLEPKATTEQIAVYDSLLDLAAAYFGEQARDSFDIGIKVVCNFTEIRELSEQNINKIIFILFNEVNKTLNNAY